MEFVCGFRRINIGLQGPFSGQHFATGTFDRECSAQGTYDRFQTTQMLGLSIVILPDIRNSVRGYGIKTNWCHYFNFIHILPDLYMFQAHRPIFRRVHTAVHTTIGSISVLLWSRALYRARDQSNTDTEPMVVWTAVWTLLKMGLWARNM